MFQVYNHQTVVSDYPEEIICNTDSLEHQHLQNMTMIRKNVYSRNTLPVYYHSMVFQKITENKNDWNKKKQDIPPGFDWIRVNRSLVFCVCLLYRCLWFCPFSVGHCVVCSSSIHGFWLPLWYLQTLLINTPFEYYE